LICFNCGKETGFTEFVGRRDTCPHCGADSRVCKNCEHYDPKVYNECREPSAERVLEKDRSNFCDQFTMTTRNQSGNKTKLDPRKAAEDLFKKK
jgi:hypothetical protein